MAFIFEMSTSLGGANHTSRLIEPILRWLLPYATSETIGHLHFLIRKAGHLTEYAVLALLTLRAARLSPRQPITGWSWRAAGVALLLSAGYAATDEFHQSFVPGRTASAGDMGIDTSGAAAALALAALRKKPVAQTAAN